MKYQNAVNVWTENQQGKDVIWIFLKFYSVSPGLEMRGD